MAITLNDMATSVARAIGGADDPRIIVLAKEAIKASVQDWNTAKNWNFLLRDTSLGFLVTGVAWTGSVTTIIAPSSGVFDGVNTGVSVTGTGIPASTTVASYTRGTDGTITSIELSQATTGTQSNVTLTFGANIPIQLDVDEYNLPTDFKSPYDARLLGVHRTLVYIKYREWNLKVGTQSTRRAIEAYTVYNPVSALTQNYGQYRLKIFGVPGQTDTLFLQYFRSMNPDSTNVDIPIEYQRRLIDYAQWRLLRLKNSEDSRLPEYQQLARQVLLEAMTDDEEIGDAEDIGLKSQMETWDGDKPGWSNGEFHATPYTY